LGLAVFRERLRVKCVLWCQKGGSAANATNKAKGKQHCKGQATKHRENKKYRASHGTTLRGMENIS
jgi:hypothetical protein